MVWMQDVCIVRAKNRMAPPQQLASALDLSASAPAAARTNETGYRDLAINLRVTSAAAQALGLQWHVAEVQLLLRAFADVKAEEGHARYILWRNLRGE